MAGEPLTSDEVQGVQDTWALVAKDLKGHGVQFFLAFFQQYPDYQKKFRSFANVPVAELADNKRLQAHAFTVMRAIDGLIDNLDDPEVLTELLQRTGANHARRGLVIADFQNLKGTLAGFLKEKLGEAFTPDAESGWNKVLEVMMEKIGEGLVEKSD